MSLEFPRALPLRLPAISRRLIVMVLALAVIAAVLGGFAYVVASLSPPAPPPPRNPFGVALPREALPSTTGIGALLITWQSSFYRELTAMLKALHGSSAALPALLGLAFGYGVLPCSRTRPRQGCDLRLYRRR